MVKNHNKFFKLFEERKNNVDLSNILDIPILLFEEDSSGMCYTDLDSLKQFFIDSYTEQYIDDPESLEAQVSYIKELGSLRSFDSPRVRKDFGYNKYIESIRSTIVEYFNTSEINPDNIVYDEELKKILIPVDNPKEDIENYIQYINDQYIFGVETCIGNPDGFVYDPDKELITISADFSNLNSSYSEI